MKYRLNKFTGYTLEDCRCQYCLHYAGKGKPCPLEVCCCEGDKQEAITRVQTKPDLPPLRHRLDPLQPERPACYDRTECEGCTYPAHGFLCGGAKGCLKTGYEGTPVQDLADNVTEGHGHENE